MTDKTPPDIKAEAIKLRGSMLQAITAFCRMNNVSKDTLPDPDQQIRDTADLASQIQALAEPEEDPIAAMVRQEIEAPEEEPGGSNINLC